MKRVAVAFVLTLMALVFQISTVTAEHWCGGAYDEKQGSNLGQCPGPKH